jgi:hypothetical protein
VRRLSYGSYVCGFPIEPLHVLTLSAVKRLYRVKLNGKINIKSYQVRIWKEVIVAEISWHYVKDKSKVK